VEDVESGAERKLTSFQACFQTGMAEKIGRVLLPKQVDLNLQMMQGLRYETNTTGFFCLYPGDKP
jgi:hypothetical protein